MLNKELLLTVSHKEKQFQKYKWTIQYRQAISSDYYEYNNKNGKGSLTPKIISLDENTYNIEILAVAHSWVIFQLYIFIIAPSDIKTKKVIAKLFDVEYELVWTEQESTSTEQQFVSFISQTEYDKVVKAGTMDIYLKIL